MKFLRSHLIILLLLPYSINNLFAQISLSLPVERAVYQRNSSNQAVIYIAGNYSQYIDRVDARITSLNGGTSIGWTAIQNNPQGGIFSGNLTVSGGWYSLEVRGMKGTSQIGSAIINKMGIGEVFIAAGQSNAQGVGTTSTGFDASDDRVNTINYSTPCPSFPCQIIEPPFPEFTSLNGTVKPSMNGNNKWCWGVLGDMLTSRLNVPIAFFNVAGGGSSIANWSQSAQGLPAPNFFIGGQWAGNVNFPYILLRKTLNHYGTYLGVRAILWHQGETETFREYNGSGITSTQYRDSLSYIISKSREHFNKEVAWVVSRASFMTLGGIGMTSSNVINGQNQTISTNTKVFYGPTTDAIQPRSDGVHLDNNLFSLASGWDSYLDSNFFNNATPHPAQSPVNITVTCPNDGTGRLTLTAASGYNEYVWVNGNNDISNGISNSQSVTVGVGSYRVYAKDILGNVVFSQVVEVPSNPYPPTPSISGSTVLCSPPYQPLTLTSSQPDNILWSNGATTPTISITTGGTFTVAAKSVWGCTAISNPFTVTQTTGVIASASDTYIYAGQPTTLNASGCSSSVNWSNGAGNGNSVVVIPPITTTFIATCPTTGCSANVIINVTPCPSSLTISTPLTNVTTTFKAVNTIEQ